MPSLCFLRCLLLAAFLCLGQSRPPMKYLFIGNPGVGKSTILNGLYRSHGHGNDTAVNFKSGISFGTGLTHKLDVVKGGDDLYIDTPGLAGEALRGQASEAITEGLRMDGNYKVMFVVTESNGRVASQDMATMRLVQEAANLTSYGIIVNQVSLKVFEQLKHNMFRQHFLMELMKELHQKTSLIHFIPRDESLEGAEDVVHYLPRAALAFIDRIPSIAIPKETVKDVQHDRFDAVLKALEERLSKLDDNGKALEERLEAGRYASDQTGLHSQLV